MALGGKHSLSKKEIGVGWHGGNVGIGGESRVPLSKGERKKRLEYDASVAKTVLAIVGVALVALLLWLDYKGY